MAQSVRQLGGGDVVRGQFPETFGIAKESKRMVTAISQRKTDQDRS